MYVTIGSSQYNEIKNLAFEPQIDITGDSVPINEMSVEIKTYDDISVGQYISLYDDLDQLWAKYWITYADRVDVGFVRIDAQSVIGILDRFTLPAVVYETDTAIGTALDTVFAGLTGIASYTIDSSLSSATVRGYCPEQTARERLQWLCFVANAYVRQAFTNTIEIKSLDVSTVTDIPITRTYWKPSIEYSDFVTAIGRTTYEFTEGTPSQDDEYVTVDGVDYIISSSTFQLTNTGAPASAAPNIITVDRMYLANDDNVSDLASRLALLYFARNEVDADVINNRYYEPAQKVSIQLDGNVDVPRYAIGYIESASFSFGLQAKSRLKIVASEVRTLTALLIKYMYENVNVATKRYNFPEGYNYQIENPYIDKASGTHRYIFRPVNQYATGTIVQGTNINEQDVEIALHWYGEEKLLHVVSVSEIEYDSEEGVIEIG